MKIIVFLENILNTARINGSIFYILKNFLLRHSSEYEKLDSDRKVIRTVNSHLRIDMVR